MYVQQKCSQNVLWFLSFSQFAIFLNSQCNPKYLCLRSFNCSLYMRLLFLVRTIHVWCALEFVYHLNTKMHSFSTSHLMKCQYRCRHTVCVIRHLNGIILYVCSFLMCSSFVVFCFVLFHFSFLTLQSNTSWYLLNLKYFKKNFKNGKYHGTKQNKTK